MLNDFHLKITKKLIKKTVKVYIHVLKDNEICAELKFSYFDSITDIFSEYNIPENIINKYYSNNNTIYIDSLSVEDKYKQKGLSNILMNKFIEIFNNQKYYSTTTLLAFPFKYGQKQKIPTETLIKFYERFNFKLIGIKNENLMVLKK